MAEVVDQRGFYEFGDNFARSNRLQFIESHLGDTPITLIVDDTCKRKYEQGELYGKHLRIIHGYFVCDHVAFARFNCHHKIFFYKPRKNASVIPDRCPFVDGGRLIRDSCDE
jgi:hypothetical protein